MIPEKVFTTYFEDGILGALSKYVITSDLDNLTVWLIVLWTPKLC